jgi:hypothetical protein
VECVPILIPGHVVGSLFGMKAFGGVTKFRMLRCGHPGSIVQGPSAQWFSSEESHTGQTQRKACREATQPKHWGPKSPEGEQAPQSHTLGPSGNGHSPRGAPPCWAPKFAHHPESRPWPPTPPPSQHGHPVQRPCQ